MIVPYRVRFGLEKQRWCFPAFGGVGAAFGVVVGFGTLLAPRLSPPKSRPDGRLAPIRACGRSRFATRYREVAGATAEGGTSGTLVTEILGAPQRETVKEKQTKSVLQPGAWKQFVAGCAPANFSKAVPAPNASTEVFRAVSCWAPSF